MYSIDFPLVVGDEFEGCRIYVVIPKGKKLGWVIPKFLKRNWELIIGKSQIELPQLLKKLKKIDFFMHDSNHTYDLMWFEYNKAFRALNHGGILISQDINKNTALYDFCEKHNKRIIKLGPITGAMIMN